MPDVKFATADVSAMKLGTANVSKVMLGTTEVWPGAPSCTDVLTEPFNNFSAAPWTIVGSPATIVAGRTGTAASFNGASAWANYTIPSVKESAYLTIGFAFKTNYTLSNPLAGLWSDGKTTEHNRIEVDGSGHIVVSNPSAGAVGTSTATVVVGTWYYLEAQIYLHDSAGWLKVRLNGTEIINVTARDTRNGGTKTVYDSIQVGPGGFSNEILLDDLYISTGAGCAFKGDPVPPATCTDVLTEPFNNLSAWSNSGASLVTGRTGTGVACNVSSLEYTLPADETITLGFAYKTSHVNPVHDVFATMLAGAYEMRCSLSATGGLSFARSGTQTLGTTGNVITATNTWYYIEVQIRSHDTLGTLKVRVNGTELLNLTGLDTRAVGLPNQLSLREVTGTTGTYDDLYLSTGPTCPFKGSITP